MSDATVRQTLTTWIDSKSGALAEASLKAYKQAAELFLSFLGPRAEKTIRRVTKRDAVAFRDWLAKGRSPSTANKIKTHLGGAFESAKSEGILDQNVVSLTDNLKATSIEKDTFSPEQVARLVAAAKSADWKGAIILGYTSAARLMDVCNMMLRSRSSFRLCLDSSDEPEERANPLPGPSA